MKIYLAADHAGFELKNELEAELKREGHEVMDLGAHELDPGDDYPPLANAVAEKVLADNGSRGIMICGSGEGMAIAANRHDGIRASVIWDEAGAKETRQDNDSNVLSLPARSIDRDLAKRIVQVWFATPFSKEQRHERRIAEIDQES